MKIASIKKKITINFSVAGVLLLIFGLIFNFYLHQENNVRLEVDKITNETSILKNEALILESKDAEFKKYKSLWENLSPNKKNTNGIKSDSVNSKLAAAQEKYSIGDPNLKITLPEILQSDLFKRNTFNVLFTTVNLSFSAANDIKALLFVNEFLESLPGYPIVTFFEIRKSKDYTSQDLANISSGASAGVVFGRLDFFWYIYKEKEMAEPSTPTAKEN